MRDHRWVGGEREGGLSTLRAAAEENGCLGGWVGGWVRLTLWATAEENGCLGGVRTAEDEVVGGWVDAEGRLASADAGDLRLSVL